MKDNVRYSLIIALSLMLGIGVYVLTSLHELVAILVAIVGLIALHFTFPEPEKPLELRFGRDRVEALNEAPNDGANEDAQIAPDLGRRSRKVVRSSNSEHNFETGDGE